ncbi:hypothetical protein TIFTF001_047436 [Ficus carica]|uniref:Uncharacterized protein n=1 Tax=Ficus carica TaxID=3494 RepID=A0AA88CMP2_FICCA|nr:hypothetical protein TIFTF001_047434 [Ficus carica]GMN22449.1 hypothetical protein TIFTF001_047436 [Ficus carica]
MGVTGKRATVPVRAGDRRVVQEQGWFYYPDKGALSATPFEHVPVPARTGEVVGQRTYSRRTSGSKHCRSSGRYVLGHVSSSRNVVGVLGNKQLPEKRPLMPRVACVSHRWCHVAHHHEQEGKAAL